MSNESFATIGQLKEVKDEITKRQDDYEKMCEEDRVKLRGEVHALTKSMNELKEETAKQTKMLGSVLKQIGGFFANPRIVLASTSAILALLAYVTYRLTTATPLPQQQQMPVPIYIYPQHIDGGLPSITVQ